MQHLWMQAAVKNDRRRRLQRQLLLSFSTQMLSIVVFLSLLIILVSGLKELKVNPGQDASLQCQGPRDAEITLLEWNRADLKSDDYVFMYRNQRPYESYQHVSFRGRVDLMDPSMKDGNVSVTLRNVRLSDTGTYKCQITTKETESVVHECSINLTVTTPDKDSKASKDGGERDKCLCVTILVL
ncbi:coxsackievirus and adenovirus receptor homolog isoform X2 [Oreochromis niloticus]|uniref:coxsackievirus and adenovirus receptor homolog isoform X2 n=1 Tax=Oreochromis niloticus TaxID=8128 RepID=UPI000DF27007|nr:coxsackievirus and adenovirus receptor homolog isoform X2 [Oreochromis niloticus]